MNLYVGQEIPIPHNHCNVIITEVVEHQGNLTARAKQVENNNLPNVFIRIVEGIYCFDNVREDLEDYLPSILFDSVGECFLRIVISFYWDFFRLKSLSIEIFILIIESKEDYLYHYGGMLKLLNLYETYEKRIDHIIKTLVLLLHFDLTTKEKIWIAQNT